MIIPVSLMSHLPMIEDKLLIWRFKRGNPEALCRIYEKYENYLLTLATGLLNRRPDAEDVVHDVFVSFAQSAEKFKIGGNLKGYLSVCVANQARDLMRTRKLRSFVDINEVSVKVKGPDGSPEGSAAAREEVSRLNLSLAQLPDEQKETIVLHLKGDLTFRQIAQVQNVSINTVQGRYRYGLDKLRSLLNGEVSHETK
jgi:RNA polymerase sigma factor (sigma-70 family)